MPRHTSPPRDPSSSSSDSSGSDNSESESSDDDSSNTPASPSRGSPIAGSSSTSATTTTTVVSSQLECKICFDPCASPIYNCEKNGHLICGICYFKMEAQGELKCPLKCPGKLTPSSLGERLSREHDIRIECPYKDSGCSETPIKATELTDHLENCDYRDLLCNLSPCSDNGNNRIPLNKYRQHMTEVHEVSPLKNIDHHTFRNLKAFTIGDPFSLELWKGIMKLQPVLVEFDSKLFQLHAEIREYNLHYWFTILGDPNQAEKYMVKTKLVPPKKAKTKFQYDTRATFPILSSHHAIYNKFCGAHATVSASTLSQFYNLYGESDKCRFRISWKIYKLKNCAKSEARRTKSSTTTTHSKRRKV